MGSESHESKNNFGASAERYFLACRTRKNEIKNSKMYIKLIL